MKFYSDVINENTNNQRVLFSCFGKMLNTSAAKKLPTHDCPRNLANMFADYFDSKVRCIRASFPHRAKCLLFSGHLLAVHEISQVCHIT